MPKIITIAHQKGGVGKSTIAFNLAYAFSRFTSTAVVDLDPQGTIARLKNVIGEEGPAVIDLNGQPVSMLVHQETFNVIFPDTPPYNNDRLPDLLAISDLVIIPTKAGIPDVMAIESTVRFVKEAQKKNPKLKAGIVINMVRARGGLLEEVKEQLAKYELPILAELGNRVAYEQSLLSGGVLASTNAVAIGEFTDFVNKVLELL